MDGVMFGVWVDGPRFGVRFGVLRAGEKKYRGLSTAAAKSATSGRDDVNWWRVKEKQIPPLRYGMEMKKNLPLGLYFPPIAKSAMDGAPARSWLVGERRNTEVLRFAQNDDHLSNTSNRELH